MTAVSVKPVGVRGDGKEIVRAMIIADSAPGSLPTTGEGIVGMTANQVFAPFSMLYVAENGAENKVYIANEKGTFVAQGGE